MVLLGTAPPLGTAGRWDAGLFLRWVPVAGGPVWGPVSLVSQHSQGQRSTQIHLLPCKTEANRWSQSWCSRLGPPAMLGHPRTAAAPAPTSCPLPSGCPRVPALTGAAVLIAPPARRQVPGNPWGRSPRCCRAPRPTSRTRCTPGDTQRGTRRQRWDRGHSSGPFGTRVCREQPPASHQKTTLSHVPPCKPSCPPSLPGTGFGACLETPHLVHTLMFWGTLVRDKPGMAQAPSRCIMPSYTPPPIYL